MSDRLLTPSVDLHYTRLFRSPVDRSRYRAECSCGQAREGERDEVQNWVAGHDLPPMDEVESAPS